MPFPTDWFAKKMAKNDKGMNYLLFFVSFLCVCAYPNGATQSFEGLDMNLPIRVVLGFPSDKGALQPFFLFEFESP
jgi:hypothetical protein